MDEDTGNPWLALPKTYKGKFQITSGDGVTIDSHNVMLSSDNDVTFMGNAEMASYTSGGVILTLPESCRPAIDIIALFPTTYDYTSPGGSETRNISFKIPSHEITGNISVTIPRTAIPVSLPVSDASSSISKNISLPSFEVPLPAQSVTIDSSMVSASLSVPAKTLTGSGTASFKQTTVNLWPEQDEKRLITNGSGFAVADYTVASKDIVIPGQSSTVTVTIKDSARVASGNIVIPEKTVQIGGSTVVVPPQTIPFSANIEISGQTSKGTIVIPEQTVTTDVVLNSGEVAVDTEAVISVPSATGTYTEAVPFTISANGEITADRDLTNAIVHLAGNSYNIGVNWYREED